MNGERIEIVAHIVQLIDNCFEAKPHIRKDRKRRIFVKHMLFENIETTMLSNTGDTLLDSIPESIPDFLKVYQPKTGKT